MTILLNTLPFKSSETNVYLITATEATLPDLGWGFIEDAYKLYNSNPPNSTQTF